jgi:hypothetical protein
VTALRLPRKDSPFDSHLKQDFTKAVLAFNIILPVFGYDPFRALAKFPDGQPRRFSLLSH